MTRVGIVSPVNFATLEKNWNRLVTPLQDYYGIQFLLRKRCAGMGGLQQTAINCGKQNIKPEKSRGCDSNRIRVLESP
nr:hypothetical protein [Xenococcaceae cyanobacterium MO_234.B1]